MNTRQRGAEAERRARRHYQLRGYRILDANVWAGGNELDLVVRRGRSLVFCEVKQKSGPGFGDPAEMVTGEKQRRVRRAATAWLARHPRLEGLDIRFDVVAVSPAGVRRITHAF
ncbi:MAG: YraN family protein [Gaiellaceae bacterium]